MNTYTIKITERDLKTLAKALDTYIRLGLGQFDTLSREYQYHYGFLTPENHKALEYHAGALQQLLTGFDQGGHGITHPKVKDEFKSAREIHEQIRATLQDRPPVFLFGDAAPLQLNRDTKT